MVVATLVAAFGLFIWAIAQPVAAQTAGAAQAITYPSGGTAIDAIIAKNQWWGENNEVHSAEVDGPFVGNDDKFAVYYNYDVTFKPSGKRNNMEEMALYTVKDGKIVREQFFYRTS